jgi:signal transduction histidine kinase
MTRAYLRYWEERWRYPGLVSAEAEDATIGELSRAVLDGILAPVADKGEAVGSLAALGRFDDAAKLAAADDMLQTKVDRARDEAVQTTERIVAELQGRAQRAGISAEPPPNLVEDASHSLPVATGRLADWREQIQIAEQKRTLELEQQLHAAGNKISASRADSVRHCLQLLEFGAAEQLLEAAEDEGTTLGPEAFPRLPDWPRQYRLDWYLTDIDSAPPHFNVSWRPPEADTRAWRVLEALNTLSRSPSPDAVKEFAAGLDALLGDLDVAHWVEEAGEGITTSIAGLQDPRLPGLALPRRFPLWFSPSGAAPPRDLERPVIWLALGGVVAPILPGTAVVQTTSLLPLLAPDRDGRPLTLAARTIAMLRSLCQQLRLADLIGSGDGLEFADVHNWRYDIKWLLDLLGVRVSEGALDIMAYDTGRDQLATRALLEGLVPDGTRPSEITGETLADWHRDQAALERFRDRVFDVIFRDAETRAALAATLWVYGSSPDRPFTLADIEDALALAQMALAEAKPGELLTAEQPSAYLYLPSVVEKALETGLLCKAGESEYTLGPRGLMGLLAGDPGYLLGHVNTALAELSRRSELLTKSMRSRLTMDAIRHLFDNHLSAFAELASSLSELRTQLPAELTEKVNYAISHYERMEDYRRRAEAAALEELQRPREFDLGVLVQELRDELSDRRISISVTWDEIPLMVHASRFMVKMAFENLIVNARRVIAESDRPRGSIQITVAGSNDPARPDPTEAFVDIKDTGPGFPSELLPMLGADLDDSVMGGANGGLPQARKLLMHCGGSLLLVAPASDLGGAHFRIRLPLAAVTPYQP